MSESQFANHPNSKCSTAAIFWFNYILYNVQFVQQVENERWSMKKYRRFVVFKGSVLEANGRCQSRKDCRNTKHSPRIFKIHEFLPICRVCGTFWDAVDSSFSYTSKVAKQKRVYRYWRCLPGRKAILF